MSENPHLNPRAAWRFPAKIREPRRYIEWRGEKWIEVEWPSDGRYDIGYQLAHELGGAMCLFELASRREP